MATERVSMRRAREILRLKWCEGLSHRAIATSLGVSPGTVSATAARAAACGLDWASVEGLGERALEARLYPQAAVDATRAEPDMVWIHTELRRPGVTLELLHLEYLEQHPEGYRMTAFGERYRSWLKRCRPSMRQVHRAGEKTFVDYSGKRPSIVDPATGESVPVELFVAVLGASNYTYAEASATQQVADWIASHVRAFEFFEGASAVLVPDQLKSGVSASCRYEPGVQRTYAEMATHHGAVVVPARPRKPRDKPKVEVAVQIVQRWILARLRNERFTSLAALNKALGQDDADPPPCHRCTHGRDRRLRWEDIYWQRRKLLLDGKTGERLGSVSQAVIDELAAIKPKNASGRVLPVSVSTARTDIRKVLKAACKEAGIPYFPPKQIRTMVDNTLFDMGADPGVVSAQLGHTPEVSLRHYRQVKAKRVEEVIEKAGLGVRPDGNVVSLAQHRRSKDG